LKNIFRRENEGTGLKRSHVLAFIIAATLVATFHTGVRFAVIDQQAQLPVIYRQLDPTLFSRDFMYQANSAFGPRYFVNLLFAFLARLFPMEPLTLAGVLLINFLILWITYRVAAELFSASKLTPLLSVVLVGAMGNSLFPLAPLITAELDPRAMGMPLALLALWLALRNWPIWCSVVALIGSLIHPLLLMNTMAIALIGMGLRWIVGIVTRGRVGSEKPGRDFLFLAAGGALFGVVSYFLWMVGYDISGLDSKTLFELTQFRTPRSYLMWNFWGPKPFILFVVFTLGAVWSWLWWHHNSSDERREAFTVLGMIIGTGFMLAGAVIFVEFIPVRTWLSLDASSGIFVARWLGFLLIAHTASQLLELSVAGQPSAFGSSIILLCGTGPAMPLTMFWGHIVETVRRRWCARLSAVSQQMLMIIAMAAAISLWIASGSLKEIVGVVLLASLAIWFAVVPERRFRVVVPLAAAAVLTVLVFALNGRIHNDKVFRATSLFHQVFSLKDVRVMPGVGEQYAAMVDVGTFARRHTLKDALFLTPPLGSLFRISSRRSIAIDFKGMPGRPVKMLEWRQRLENCYGPWINMGYDAVNEMDRNYSSISREKLAELRKVYDVDYAVLYIDTLPAGMTVLYHNTFYALVDLKPLERIP
jgi:hypothetical protein